MITPMYKYNFLVYHRDFDDFLLKLQDLGVVDISMENRNVDEDEKEILARINRIATAIKFLEGRKAPDEKITLSLSADEIVSRVELLQREREQFENAIKKAQKELAEVEPWGNFDLKLLNSLAEKGISIRFFIAPEKVFNEDWVNEYPIEIVNHTNGLYYFVMVNYTGEAISPDVQEVRTPQFSVKQKDEEIHRYHKRIDEINTELDFLALYIDLLKKEQIELTNQLDFKMVKSSATAEAGNTIMVLEGWVPEDLNEKVKEVLDAESIIYISSKADKNDNAPILLRNSKFAKLFEPISKLFAFPTYAELDLTPFFAPFFMLFFGFCFGDAGYGLIFVLGATIYKFKAKPELKPLLSLIQILGISTVLFGALTGTVFGASLVELDIPALESFKSYFFDQDKMFKLSLILGLVQIVFGMCVKAANLWVQFSWKHAISTISWVVLILSMAVFYLLGQNPESSLKLFSPIHMVIVGVAGVGIMFFNSPGKNPLFNFGLGLWDTYNMATGLLGDTLSYIRLFALGLSSGILGSVFNSLAFGMAPDTPVLKHIVIILILLIGHSINIFMSALGSLVHPMRLTFVEFYKNAGFTGGGRGYNPFRKNTAEAQ
ncbi:MAG: V-type ATPase 116kDa subunit family protein [Tenuifilum sp.]|uniref:V-type ATP synthase subunit I n=1 Tax=Tenuifilum sp. TaxID=2760880 RepID=UPI001B5335DC|nr:V-type ATP synthase subunit I [Bacteroidales bacterium]HOK60333.1 V-type ATPase 116kDa subunit family protein [Tenuifilum sp.]HOK85225.1 V-type ATPase 116kDa subunit family protein [Tenuifilum sp.]HON69601.1 V-type ATPase 116kDa subunit family protein [Tenuifilum sp.]HOU74206.1 V-type ATPase 116kDa subunit family protein [Tenuifilum sp.]